MAANRLRRLYPLDELSITVVDEDDRHLYQPGLLFVPFGMASPKRLVRSRSAQLRPGIAFREAVVEAVDTFGHIALEADAQHHCCTPGVCTAERVRTRYSSRLLTSWR